MEQLVLILFVFVFGAVVGSFLNVVIYRMPRDESIVSPGSHCPGCDKPIATYDNIPILSWIVLGGKCRRCGISISPQYILVEAVTGLMLVGLYVCYFILRIRTFAGAEAMADLETGLNIQFAWPMFVAHAALLCALLASSIIDIRHYIVPLQAMWAVSIVGAAAAAFRPHPFLPTASAMTVAISLAAGAGVVLSIILVRTGLLRQSFAGLDERADEPEPQPEPKKKKRKRGSVGITAADGVNPRLEMLWEILFLLPAVGLAIGAWALLAHCQAAGNWWAAWFDESLYPQLAPRLAGAGGALFGFLIGGAVVWGTRILATIGFGKEAMGMGDVHLMAGVGAVTGWVIPTLAFFIAPLSGILFVLYLLITRRQRELPYGPWLALGTVLTMLFYDGIVRYISPGLLAIFSDGGGI